MATMTPQSTTTDVLLQLTYELVVTHELRMDEEALASWREIFDATLGDFLERHPAKRFWEAPKFKALMVDIVGRIATKAKADAQLPSAPVSRREFARAATAIMREVDTRNECRDVLEEWQQLAVSATGPLGPICFMYLKKVAGEPVAK